MQRNVFDRLRRAEVARKIHLALGGGGARTLAHLGVLQAIEAENLPLARLSGTSGGAILAALYAQLGHSAAVIERVRTFINGESFRKFGLDVIADGEKNDKSYLRSMGSFFHYIKSRLIYSRAVLSESLFPAQRMLDLLTELLWEGRIEDLPVPLQLAAVDLESGEAVVFDRGDLILAVAASSAIPGVFSPVEIKGRHYFDGAVLNPVPLIRINRDREVVVAVDVSHCIRGRYPQKNAVDYIIRADEITTFRLNEAHLRQAEILIRPEAVRRGHWADFRHFDEYVQSGFRAAQAKMPVIRRATQLRQGWIKKWLCQRLCEAMELGDDAF